MKILIGLVCAGVGMFVSSLMPTTSLEFIVAFTMGSVSMGAMILYSEYTK